MNKIKLLLVLCAFCLVNSVAYSATGEIGMVNFKKVASNYTYAKNIAKEIDNEILNLNQYLLDKDKELKAIESPIAKKNFEEKTIRDYKTKEEALLNKRNKIDSDVTNTILNATKIIAQQKQIDTVLDYRIVVIGGKDLTDDVIKYLNAQPAPKK